VKGDSVASSTSDFITVFNGVEKYLRRLCKEKVGVPFRSLVRKASASHAGVAVYATTLEEFAHLRNAVIHSLTDGRAMATPYAEAVEELDAIRLLLLAPPRLIDHFGGPVLARRAEDRIDTVLQEMLKEDFSQIPVFQEAGFLDLLNTDTVARWFADHTMRSCGCIKDETVGHVLRHAENYGTDGPKGYWLVNEDADAFNGLKLFEDGYRRGRSLDAIIITKHGEPSDSTALGILTKYDLPKLQSLVHQPSMRGGT
jgi:hypothetical protein